MSWNPFRRKNTEQELDEELRFHIEMEAAQNRERGLAPDEARRVAMVALGGAAQTREAVRDLSCRTWLDGLALDARYALRQLRKTPVFTAVAILSLGLGIGANTAVFSLVDSTLFRGVPGVNKSNELYWLSRSYSYPLYQDFRGQNHAFDGLIGIRGASLALERDGASKPIWGQAVTANYFTVLGVKSAAGRLLIPAEDESRIPSVVLSYRFWQNEFAGDPEITGKTVKLSGTTYTVVGVAQGGFEGLESKMPVDLWAPMRMLPELSPRVATADNEGDIFHQRSAAWMNVIGRLKPGVSPRQAEAELNLIRGNVEPETPSGQHTRPITVVQMQGTVDPRERSNLIPIAVLLFGVVGTVLLICCTNLANLLLARALARHSEMGVRLALGCSRARLLRQLLVESLLLAVAGGAVGLGLTYELAGLPNYLGAMLHRPVELALTVDSRVLLFTVVVSLITGIFFGLAPGLNATRRDVLTALRRGVTLQASGTSRIRSLLIAAQVTFSVVLLVVAGLFLRSLMHANQLDPGFAIDGRLVINFQTNFPASESRTTIDAFYADLISRVQHLPGVSEASYSRFIPLSTSRGMASILLEPDQKESAAVPINIVATRYFHTIGIPLLEGRDFTERDNNSDQPVMIVNQAFARQYFRGQSPVGKRLWYSPKLPAQVVGMAGNSILYGLGDADQPMIYLPVYEDGGWGSAHLIVSTSLPAAELLAAVQNEIKAVGSSGVAILEAETMRAHVDDSLVFERLGAQSLTLFGVVALMLAAIGVYGVLAYAAGQRQREIGIRIALGAPPGSILSMLVGTGMRVVFIATGVGLVLVTATSHFLRSFLIEISPLDPLTLVVVPLVLLGVTLVASYLPARRATKVDPMIALRYE